MEGQINNQENKKMDFSSFRDYAKWTPVKAKIHNNGVFRTFSEGWIYWCIVGENVGTEINGKGELYMRPVLIIKKISSHNFVGIPLTTQAHGGFGFVKFRFKNKNSYAVLSQIKTFSVFRLARKMGQADDSDMSLIKERLKEFLNL